MASLIEDVTFVIKTFQRPASLARLLKSISNQYPGARILVGDDGFDPAPVSAIAHHVRLPVDTGVGEGRNRLLAMIDSPFFLLLDDDFEFYAETVIELLLETLVADDRLSLVAGVAVSRDGETPGGPNLLVREGATLHIRHGYREKKQGYLVTDMVPNFFVGRTEDVRLLAWDSRLKVYEHVEFFLRMKQAGLKAGYHPRCRIREWNDRPAGYFRFRNRKRFWHMAMRKHGLTQVVWPSGYVVTVR